MMALSNGSIRGATRMQKMALLISKDLGPEFESRSLFTDWSPDNFGGLSVQVYRARDELIEKGLVEEKEIEVQGKKMKILDVTLEGRKSIMDLPPLFGDSWLKVSAAIKKYAGAKTTDLIDLSYQRYPE